MYREWKKIGFPKEYCTWIWKQQDQEIDGWMKWGSMEEWSAERSGRKNCMTGRNGRGSWERQGITAFCTCQWIDWLIHGHLYACRRNEFIRKIRLKVNSCNINNAHWFFIFIYSLVFSLRGRVGRNQSPVMWPVWLWHTASWASPWG